MWEPWRLSILWASMASYRERFSFVYVYSILHKCIISYTTICEIKASVGKHRIIL
jgi:hypothetical protein